MIESKRCEILLIDKKSKYDYLFNGFRKNKFCISVCSSILRHTDDDFLKTHIFFVVLYDTRDVIQLVKLFDVFHNVIVGSDNKRILNSFQKIKRFPLIDLSNKQELFISLHKSIFEILD
jgi:hypothetical protein